MIASLPFLPDSVWTFPTALVVLESFCQSPVVFSENCSTCRGIFDVFMGGGECHVLLCHLDLFPVAGLVSKETYLSGLSWVAARCVDFCTCLPNLKSLYRGLNWVQSHTQSGWSQHHITVSRLCPWAASSSGKATGTYIPRTGMGVRSL